MAASAYSFEMEYERLRQGEIERARYLEARRAAAEEERAAYEERARRKAAVAAKPKSFARTFVGIVVAFAVCFFLVNRYVAVYETGNRAAEAKNEYEAAARARVKAAAEKGADFGNSNIAVKPVTKLLGTTVVYDGDGDISDDEDVFEDEGFDDEETDDADNSAELDEYADRFIAGGGKNSGDSAVSSGDMYDDYDSADEE